MKNSEEVPMTDSLFIRTAKEDEFIADEYLQFIPTKQKRLNHNAIL